MRGLFIFIVLTLMAWSAYWLVGKTSAETVARSWLEDRRAEGWQAEAQRVATAGYPYRFDTRFEDLALADPRTGWAWTAPLFQVLTLAYKPTHFIAVWPDSQTLATPFEQLSATTSEMRASVVFAANTDLALRRGNLVIADLALTSNHGWSAQLKRGLLATEQDEAAPTTYQVGFSAEGLTPAAALKRQLDPAGLLPNTFETLKIDATVGFDAPWDRRSIENNRPQITALDLKLAQATWGNLDLRAAGQLLVDPSGIPEGKITIKATNWREILTLLVEAGLLPRGLQPAAESAMERLAQASGNPKTLDVPLSLSGGRIFFGPIPIGAAPNLRLR